MKVRKSDLSNCFEIVVDDYGTQIELGTGKATFAPIAVCKVPIGYGRDEVQAERLAKFIAACLCGKHPKHWLEGSNAETEFGIRTLENSGYKKA